MEDNTAYYKIVEEGIKLAGVDPNLCRTGQEGQWNLKRKETELWVDIWYVEQDEKTYFQVMTPIVTLPTENKEKFYKELLDLNYQLINAQFVTYKEGVYIKITKEVEFISAQEVFMILHRIGFYGEIFIEGLMKQFGVQKLEHHE